LCQTHWKREDADADGDDAGCRSVPALSGTCWAPAEERDDASRAAPILRDSRAISFAQTRLSAAAAAPATGGGGGGLA